MTVAGLPVAVVGGSLVGLTAALLLRDLGCDVQVYERSDTPLSGRGVGIVLHPETVRYLTTRGGDDLSRQVATAARHRYLDRGGRLLSDIDRRHYFTGYTALYRALLGELDAGRYHLGHRLVDLTMADTDVLLRLATPEGECERRCALLVAADGISSTVRGRLLPGVTPRYAGYVGWRAVLPWEDLSPASDAVLSDALTYFMSSGTHALTYPIPHPDPTPSGHELVNLVWYRNAAPGPELDGLLTDRSGTRRSVSVPAGMVAPDRLAEVRAAAAEQLPAPFAEILAKAEEPFVQVLFDIAVPRMAFGRGCLIGDAAFAVRPHAATATAKGVADAWALAAALESAAGDVPAALGAWEPGQLALGGALLERNRRLGDGLQFTGEWEPGDPGLAFGLRVPGDSATLLL